MLYRIEVVIIRPTRDRQCDNQLRLPMDYGGQTQCAFLEPVNQFSTSVGQSSRKKYFWYIYMYIKLPTNIDSSGQDSVLIHSCCIFVFLTSVTCSFSLELSSLRSNLFIQMLTQDGVRGTAFLLLLCQGLRVGSCVWREEGVWLREPVICHKERRRPLLWNAPRVQYLPFWYF